MRAVFNKGQSDRMTEPKHGITPKMGRTWWFWIPRIDWNGGIPAKHNCCDITLKFLCYWVGVLIWRNSDG